jgi:hypothetical protein
VSLRTLWTKDVVTEKRSICSIRIAVALQANARMPAVPNTGLSGKSSIKSSGSIKLEMGFGSGNI